MAWTAPRTWLTGEIVTATQLNTDVRDNLKSLGPIDYAEVTADVSVTATVESTPNDVVSAAAITYEAAPILVEFFCPEVDPADGNWIRFSLWDGATDLGRIGSYHASGAVIGAAVKAERRLTPTAASHTYKIRAHTSGGTGTVHAGAGGVAAYSPTFIRITYDPTT